MKYVTPRSSSVGRPNPKAMRELLDLLWKARQELAARKAAQESAEDPQGTKSTVVKTK